MLCKFGGNSSKIKDMFVNSVYTIYNNKALGMVRIFKYLGFMFPPKHKWHECAYTSLGMNVYAFESFSME